MALWEAPWGQGWIWEVLGRLKLSSPVPAHQNKRFGTHHRWPEFVPGSRGSPGSGVMDCNLEPLSTRAGRQDDGSLHKLPQTVEAALKLDKIQTR